LHRGNKKSGEQLFRTAIHPGRVVAIGTFGQATSEADLKARSLSNLLSFVGAAAFLRLGVAVLVGLIGVCTAASATADDIIGFYFHGFGLSSQGLLYYPHAFVTIDPAPESDATPDSDVETELPSRSFGFTAVHPGPALLLHPTRGQVIEAPKAYLSASHRRFAVRVTDAQYQSLLDAVSAWRAVEGDPYDLHRRNCIAFVAILARAIGLEVGDARVLDPARFLTDLRQRNIARVLPDPVPDPPPLRTAASGR
jgi:hypothetical protein